MKKHRRLLPAVVGLILFLGGILWLMHRPTVIGPSVTFLFATNSPSPLSREAVFRLTNGYERAVLLTDLIVETNSVDGWKAFGHTVPSHPQRLATGDTKDLVVPCPAADVACRLRVAYGTDVNGLMLFVGKAAYAISTRAWPKQGFGIMSGSNSCISKEVRR